MRRKIPWRPPSIAAECTPCPLQTRPSGSSWALCTDCLASSEAQLWPKPEVTALLLLCCQHLIETLYKLLPPCSARHDNSTKEQQQHGIIVTNRPVLTAGAEAAVAVTVPSVLQRRVSSTEGGVQDTPPRAHIHPQATFHLSASGVEMSHAGPGG